MAAVDGIGVGPAFKSTIPTPRFAMIHTLVVQQFSKMLGNLLAILERGRSTAAEKKFDVAVLPAVAPARPISSA